MKKRIKRMLSIGLALIMVLSLFPTVAIAADVTLEFVGATVTASTESQTVTVTLRATEAIDVCSFGGTLTASEPLTFQRSNIKVLKGEINEEEDPPVYSTSWVTLPSGDYNEETGQIGRIIYADDPTINAHTQDIMRVTVTIPGNTPAGDYTVTFSEAEVCYDGAPTHTLNATTYTATITVEDPAVVSDPPAAAYELYYTLDSTTDDDTDNYIEYNPGATVTATVYIKAAAADTLQAVDFYVTNDAKLVFGDVGSSIGAVRVASGTNASTATSQHIQVIGSSKEDPINVNLPANEAVAIAVLTFTVADTAVHDVGMPITISAANFAMAGTPANYQPTIGGTTLGVETLKTYTVTYDDNVADEEIAVPADDVKQYNIAYDVQFTSNATYPPQQIVREGYDFVGWDTDASATTATYTETGTTQIPADDSSRTGDTITLYAIWQPVEVDYTVQHRFQSLDDPTAYGENADYPDETLTGLTGADTEAVAKTVTGFTAQTVTQVAIAGDGSTVVVIKYDRIKYTVTWNSQDGETNYETDSNVPYGTAPSYDGAVPAKDPDATYTYTFANWATAEDAESGTAVGSLPAVSGNTDYYAAFSKTYIDYTVEYALGDHAADGQNAPASETKHNGDTVTLPAGPAAADGYTFTGWSDGTNTYNAGATYTINGAGATFTAQYADKTYTVAYDGNTSTGGTTPASHNAQGFTADFTAAANTFEKTGYTFNGWNTKADGTGTPVTAGNTYKISTLGLDSTALADTTITLYAQWVRESDYAISYELNGGTLATPNPTSYNVDTPTFTLNNPTKAGYTFKGWSGTGLDGNENTTVTIAQGSTGARSYVANWTPAQVDYTVNHYQENLDGTYPATPTDTETKQGYTESDTEAAAKTYEHFTAQGFSQVEIAADGSTVVNIYYLRDTYTVTYTYSGEVPTTGDPAVAITPEADANSPYKYGATVTVKGAPASVDGYTFGGWSKTEPFEIDADTVITGEWTLNNYHIYFHTEGSTAIGDNELVSGGDVTFTVKTTSVTAPAVPEKAENTDWYEAGVWSAYDIATLSDQNVYVSYAKKTFTVTFQDENGDDLADQGTDATFDIENKTIVPPTVPEKDGYTGAWPTDITDTAGNKEVQPIYTPIEYTVTFNTDGGTAIGPMTYTIESTDTLPSAAGKTFFEFQNWKVTEADGNWAADAIIDGGTPVTGKYGNVTLTAQWTQNLNYEVQEYKYAASGYKLLIIDAAGAGDGVYTYADATMYYTTDENYLFGEATAVFYTLIEATANTLSDDQVSQIAAGEGTRATITYDGDVNGDGFVTIADANAIFQMVAATGSYYTETQLSIEQRLAADMVKATDNAEYRGSIEDVNAVVDIINGENT